MTVAYGVNVKPGKTLPNGAIVIACSQSSHERTFVVLALWRDAEYVTWITDEEGEAFWGRYFDEDLEPAVNDYFERVGDHRD